MKRKLRIRVVIMSIVLLGGAALLLLRTPTRSAGPEPVYKGRPVRDWVSEIWVADEARNPQIKEVVAIGAPAVPYLIKRLEDPRPFYARNPVYAKLWQFTPFWLQKHLPDPRQPNADARDMDQAALLAVLSRMGPLAEPAVPTLIRIVGDKNAQGPTRVIAMEALRHIGPPARGAVPALLARLGDSHLRERRRNLEFYGPKHFFPADNWDLLQRGHAALALACLDPSNTRAMQPIRLLLEATNTTARAYSAVALWRMEAGPENQRRVEAALQDPALRHMTVSALGQIGKPAAGLAPLLAKMRDETNPTNMFWGYLDHALKSMDSTSADRATSK
ncbi:MAG: hypothetical protein JWR69_1559 [Pedosphaera sp.]|nr:hypothetical protein [Pedosphaera sp.]